MRPSQLFALASAILALPLLSGCGMQSTPTPAAAAPFGVAGQVHGGQQPVSGAVIQLYTIVNTSNYPANTALPLLTKTVTSGSDGSFNITGLYSNCSGATQVYITATGGNPGLGAGASNPNLVLMAALGSCTSLLTTPFVTIDEVTTVAAVAALATYISMPSNATVIIGAPTTAIASLPTYFTNAGYFANIATGTSPGLNIPSGYTIPATTIDTLADMLVPCINSTGGAANDGSSCGDLFAYTTVGTDAAPSIPQNTVSAMLNLIKNSGTHVVALYNLVSSNTPFLPALTSAPPSYAVSFLPNPTVQFNVTGLSFSPTTVFNSAVSQTITVQNTGSTAVSITGAGIAGGNNSGNFSEVSSCPASLGVSLSCTIQVTFTPQRAGAISSFLYLDTSTSYPIYATLTGNGVANSYSPSNIFMLASTTAYYGFGGASEIFTYPASSNGTASVSSTYSGVAAGVNFYILKSDGAGNLYTLTTNNNTGTQTIQVLSIGQGGVLTATRSINVPANWEGDIDDIAADSSGRIVVTYADENKSYASTTSVFAANASGNATPTITIPNNEGFVAIDPSGNLFTQYGTGNLLEFAAGYTASSSPAHSISLSGLIGSCSTGGIAGVSTDSVGDVYVLFEGGASCLFQIAVFSPAAIAANSTTPTRLIAGASTSLNLPYYGVAVDGNGTIYVPDTLTPADGASIYEFNSTATGNVGPAQTLFIPNWPTPGSVVVY